MASEKELLPQLCIAGRVEWDSFLGMCEVNWIILAKKHKKVLRSYNENTTALSSMVQIHIQLHYLKYCLGNSIWGFGMCLEENMASNKKTGP